MMNETPLPLARMATINKPSFWIFTGVCVLLYIFNKTNTPDTGDRSSYFSNNLYIWMATFTGLFLNLITMSFKNKKVNYIFNIICYVFEIASVILLAALIFIKR
jgi:hypothetical protein